jgi:hypothetical protein
MWFFSGSVTTTASDWGTIVNSISNHLLLALTQPLASFFAPFLHFPVTGVSRLVGQNYF